jgi:hypothetical protein
MVATYSIGGSVAVGGEVDEVVVIMGGSTGGIGGRVALKMIIKLHQLDGIELLHVGEGNAKC